MKIRKLPFWSRFWRYRYDEFQPRWWRYLTPTTWRNFDEYGRRVIIWPVHPFGWVCVAFWTCKCAECDEMREQTYEFMDRAGEEA